jgi:dTDP-4-dehydrorhamnose reductase
VAYGLTAVLGGSGFLGAHVAAAALDKGAAVLSVSRRSGPPVDGAEVVRTDLARSGAIESLFDLVRPSRVLLCAAMSRASDCEGDPEGAVRLNTELPARVARWCDEHGARLVHVSTDLVFGADGPPPEGGFREGDPVAPAHLYGRTKADGEEALLAECAQALVVRLPLLYGDSFGRGLGASDALLAAVARGERPTLFDDEWRTPLEVGDAARALVELAFVDLAGRLHVAGPERTTRHELGCAVLRAAGRSAEETAALVNRGTRADAGMEAARAADASLDASLARSLLATELRAPGAALDRAEPRG